MNNPIKRSPKKFANKMIEGEWNLICNIVQLYFQDHDMRLVLFIIISTT